MARILKPSSSKKGSKKNNTDNIDGVIDWVQSVVNVFDSGKYMDLHKLKQGLAPFSNSSYWLMLKRLLASEQYFPLFQKIKKYRTQIDSIVGGYNIPANDPYYYHTPEETVTTRTRDLFTGSEGIDSIDWEGDIRILFARHLPGTRGELLLSDIAGLKSTLIGESRTRHEYEMRLENYRVDYALFIKDFCPWMSTIII